MIFEKALSFLLSHGGVYSDDPRDPGGETVWDISRKYHSSWSGWPLVDSLLLNSESPDVLNCPQILFLVKKFYRVNIWEQYRLDQLPNPVAFALLDSICNCGPKAAKWLQVAIREQGHKIEIDGLIGPVTVSLAKECQPWRLAMGLLGSRMKFYIKKRETRKKYWAGWMIRVCELMIEVADTPLGKGDMYE